MDVDGVTDELNDLQDTGVKNVFEILSHVYRRELLIALGERESGELSSLATIIARNLDNDTSVDAIRVVFQHVHLPLLEDVGVVTFDVDDRTVRLTRAGHELANAL